MAVEIERKYLVSHGGWRDHVIKSVKLLDGLVSSNGIMKVRVRLSESAASLCVKGPKKGCSRPEFEYEIPSADAEALLRDCPSILEKTRHHVPYKGSLWEVDTYHGVLEGLVLAEIELRSEDEIFELPNWAGREVTHDTNFQKGNLVKTWQRAKLGQNLLAV